jgi:ribonuclease HI
VTIDAVTEAQSLPVGPSAQKAELIALMQVLQLAARVRVNIYTDSKYAFTTIHVLYKEPYIKKGGSLIQGETVLGMDRKF